MHELECGIEDLSQSFLAFSNLLISTDLLGKHPRVTLALRKITQQYVSLAKTGCANPDEGTLNEAASIPPAIVDQGEKLAVEEPADEVMEMNDEDVPDFFKESVSHSNITSNKFTPTGLSSTSTQWPEFISLFTQPPPYKDQATPTVGVAKAPPTLESLPSLSPSPSPSATFSLPSSMKEEQWNFSQYLVKVCCQTAYQLLVTTPNDVLKIQQVFGPSLPPTERNTLISCLRAGMQDRTGDLIDYMATAIGRLNCDGESFISEGLATSPEVWNLAGAPEAGEWLDANGVQRFLSEKGFYSQDNSTRLSSLRFGSSLKIATFVQRKCSVSQT